MKNVFKIKQSAPWDTQEPENVIEFSISTSTNGNLVLLADNVPILWIDKNDGILYRHKVYGVYKPRGLSFNVNDKLTVGSN